ACQRAPSRRQCGYFRRLRRGPEATMPTPPEKPDFVADQFGNVKDMRPQQYGPPARGWGSGRGWAGAAGGLGGLGFAVLSGVQHRPSRNLALQPRPIDLGTIPGLAEEQPTESSLTQRARELCDPNRDVRLRAAREVLDTTYRSRHTWRDVDASVAAPLVTKAL